MTMSTTTTGPREEVITLKSVLRRTTLKGGKRD